MFIAHLPSGYILSVSLLKRIRRAPVRASGVILSGMVGAIAPDFDLFYFYLVDHRQVHHHTYITHWPLLWMASSALVGLWARLSPTSQVAWSALVFCLGGIVHVLLDSIAGDIWWGAPFVDRAYALVTVKATFEPWWLNFMLHWTFGVELVICCWALTIHLRRKARFRGRP